jgi:beta-glucosidase
VLPNADAILEAWYPGTMAGFAVADVLTGAYNPAGKLTLTFPRKVGQIPIYYNMKTTGRPFDANSKYTSKYLDVPNEPLFPFGFGLSYTTFEISSPTASKKSIGVKDTLLISVSVKNKGNVDGEEVVQLYIQDLVGSVTRPIKELKGFRKILLKAAQYQMVTFKITANDLRFYNEDLKFIVEKGKFKAMVGASSMDVKSVEFELK